jgi:hypothetical protein
MFEKILNWKLLTGSHPFPGSDGGTCVNEAAVVVAGLAYRSISSVEDLPPCFSRPIGEYAIQLNDCMPDCLRQELLAPFVTRLAGTADTPEVERQRADTVAVRTVTDILPIALRLCGLKRNALLCEAVKTRIEARAVAKDARQAANNVANNLTHTADATASASAVADAAAAAAAAATSGLNPARVATHASRAASATAFAAAYDMAPYPNTNDAIYLATRRLIWTRAVAILDAVLRIGRQAEPVEIATVAARADAAKAEARNLLTTQ